MELRPLKDKVLISRIAGEKTTNAGIILRTSEGPDKALVESIGPKVCEVSVGDTVLVNWNGAVPVSGKETDKEYYIIAVEHIILIY